MVEFLLLYGLIIEAYMRLAFLVWRDKAVKTKHDHQSFVSDLLLKMQLYTLM